MLVLLFVIIYLIFKNKKSKETTQRKNFDVVHSKTEKLNENKLEYYFDQNTLELFKYLKNKLNEVGESDFLWRGEENGWVYSLKNSKGIYGTVSFHKNELICNYGIGMRESFNIHSAQDVPKYIKEIIPQVGKQRPTVFSNFSLTNEEKIEHFITIIKLKMKYGRDKLYRYPD